MDIQNLDFERILKWALIVLITGFIAQFGKSFATYVMARIRAGKIGERSRPEAADRQAPQPPTLPPDREAIEVVEPKTVTAVARPEDKTQAKLRKKALKAQIKKEKKEEKKP